MYWLRAAILAGLGLGVVAATPAAAAVSAFVSTTTSERAGPGGYFPVVAVIPRGATLTLYGCLSGGSWCDVSYAGARGWVPGTYVEAYYRARRVFVPRYVAEIGVPIVSFNIGFYWGRHYHDRPFFADRFRYEHHPKGAGAQLAVLPRSKGRPARFVAHNGRAQTLAAIHATGKHAGQGQAFAKATGRHNKGAPRMFAAGGAAKGLKFSTTAKSKVEIAHRRGGKRCQASGACQF
jgi:uncharacterized protein YraI